MDEEEEGKENILEKEAPSQRDRHLWQDEGVLGKKKRGALKNRIN